MKWKRSDTNFGEKEELRICFDLSFFVVFEIYWFVF